MNEKSWIWRTIRGYLFYGYRKQQIFGKTLTAQMLDDSLVSANALIKENKTGDFYSDSPMCLSARRIPGKFRRFFEKIH